MCVSFKRGTGPSENASAGANWHEVIRFGELFVRRERTVGGKHGHAGRVTLPGGSAGRLAPPGNDGHAGRVTLPQRARYPAYPILPPPQITPVLLYYAHRKSRRKFNRSEAYEEVM